MVRKLSLWLMVSLSLVLAGCSHKQTMSSYSPTKIFSKKSNKSHNSLGESLAGFEGKGSSYYRGNGRIPRGGGKYHVGKPYQVAGKWFKPREQPGYDKSGNASWYGEAFHGRKTSNGEFFDMNMFTAAHPTLPLPSYARVTNLENGESVVVRINDRGPFVGTRIIDLSKAAASKLDYKRKGKTSVRVQWIGNAPLNDQGKHLAMMNRKNADGASMRTLIASVDGPARGNDRVQVASNDRDENAGVAQVKYEPEMKAKRNEAHIVQIGSFKSLEGAESARAALEGVGPVQVYEWQSAQGPLYKVQIGPFKSEISAEAALEDAVARGYDKARVAKVNIEQVAANY
jgi:rare lipoprotein A